MNTLIVRSALLSLLFCLGSAPFIMSRAQTVNSFTRESDGALCQLSNGTKLKLQVCAGNIIRVVYTSQAAIPAPQGLVVSKTSFTPGTWDATDNGTAVVVTTPEITATVTKSNAAVSFANSSGTAVCSEIAGGRTLAAVTKGGVAGYSGTLAFDSPADEGVYGLGHLSCTAPTWGGTAWWERACPDNGGGVLNTRGLTVDMRQANWYDVIPFFMTTRGYGVLMNFCCHAVKNPPLSFTADFLLNGSWDYFFIYGPEFDTVISGYRDLTGPAPMLAKWAYGFWQCKNRYMSAIELTTAVSNFRSRGIPLDCIVQDWNWWPNGNSGWGTFTWNTNYPNPGGMISTIHNSNCHFAISIWCLFSSGTANYTTMQPYLYNCTANGGTYYDVFNATANQQFWNWMNTSCFSIGVDGWWMDATEPECAQLTGFNTGMGVADLYSNAYGIAACKNIYDKQRAATSARRVVNLTRSMYAGQQRFGTIYWNGDLNSNDINEVRMTIAGGLNSCMAGNPYWSSDIGGFQGECTPGSSAACDEILTRWWQAETFFPIFRVHGTRATEIYNYNSQTQQICVAFDKLRYRLMPYIYSLAWKVTHENYTITRALPFDFPGDAGVRNIASQFMFGPALLVNPVTAPGATSRSVYLPAGTWYDFWTGTANANAAGRTVTASAPIQTIPLYVRSGAILPLGPRIQYTDQKQADTIELRVYAGADGNFTLYEDEGDNYGYETGSCATIPISYSNATGKVTIGARSGSFPGMLANRVFTIVFVSGGHGIADTITANPDCVVNYTGSAVTACPVAGVCAECAARKTVKAGLFTLKTADERIAFPAEYSDIAKAVAVYDISGRLLQKAVFKKRAVSVRKDLGLPKGTYIVEVRMAP